MASVTANASAAKRMRNSLTLKRKIEVINYAKKNPCNAGDTFHADNSMASESDLDVHQIGNNSGYMNESGAWEILEHEGEAAGARGFEDENDDDSHLSDGLVHRNNQATVDSDEDRFQKLEERDGDDIVDEEQDFNHEIEEVRTKFGRIKEHTKFLLALTWLFFVSMYFVMPAFIEASLGGLYEEVSIPKHIISFIASHVLLEFIFVPDVILADAVLLCIMVPYTLVIKVEVD